MVSGVLTPLTSGGTSTYSQVLASRSTIYNQCLTNSGTSSHNQAFVNDSPGINSQLIGNGNTGFDNPIIRNEDAAMYSHAMHNDDIDLDEYTLWDLLGVASSASMNQKQICVALLGCISFFLVSNQRCKCCLLSRWWYKIRK